MFEKLFGSINSLKTIFLILVINSSLLVILNLNSMSSVARLLSAEYKVYGKVQGVFFRKSTKEKADELKVFGYVQNARDGTVVGVIQGQENKFKQMKEWLCHVGSPYSTIERCEFNNERTVENLDYSTFEILRR